MKTIRQDLSKGINAVTDRRLVPEGFAIIADNVDVRSGSARPFRMPEYHLEAPDGTTKAFSYRGKWYFSELYRRYAAELYGNQERVYFCEEGPGHVAPQKYVNDVLAPLGTQVPLNSPQVSNSQSVVPQSISVVVTATGGNLTIGSYSYRVSAIIDGAIMPPSGALFGTVTTAGSKITITWGFVPGATGYVVFGRAGGQEQTLATLGLSNSWVDVGGFSSSGAFASNFDVPEQLTYVYTYVRTVGPMEDESGPSPISASTNPTQGRTITRLPLNDGFFDGATTYTNLTTAASFSPGTMASWLAKASSSILWVKPPFLSPPYVFTTGEKIRITVNGGQPANIDFSVSVPLPLDTPSAPVPGTPTGTTGLAAGTYIWKLAAIRGTAVLVNPIIVPAEMMGATTVASASSSQVVLATSQNVPLSWAATGNADGYFVYRSSDAGVTWNKIKTIRGQITNYIDDGSNEYTSVTLPASNTTATEVVVLNNINLSNYGIATQDPLVMGGEIIYLAKTVITFGAPYAVLEGDSLGVSGANPSIMNGVWPATLIDSTHLSIPAFTTINGTISTLLDIPGNNFVTSWRIYRAGDTGLSFSFVAEVPITESIYLDTVTTVNLGGTLPTSYVDGQGAIVSFAPPPRDMVCPMLYNGMLFGISGNNVIWGPTGNPDAMPAAYSKSFEYKPLALKEFAGGLIILCENGLYRADGFDASTVQFQPTRANDGCIAPYTVVSIGNGLLYLAKRGVMLFNGQTSDCITENNIPYKMLVSPSDYTDPYTAQTSYWFTTDHEAQYGALIASSMNRVTSQDLISSTVMRDVPQDGVLYEIAAFSWQNKYFLYYRDIANSDFVASTCWCIDLAMPGFPITTLGLKAIDAHVSGLNEAYVLLKDNDGDPTNIEALIQAQAQFNATFTPTAPTSVGVYRFNPVYGQNIPLRLRSPEITDGTPHLRKKWLGFGLHGDGTANVRLYLDGVLMTFATGLTEITLVCVDLPTDPRRFQLPPGSWGYSLSYEIVGDVGVRAVELSFDNMPGEEK